MVWSYFITIILLIKILKIIKYEISRLKLRNFSYGHVGHNNTMNTIVCVNGLAFKKKDEKLMLSLPA